MSLEENWTQLGEDLLKAVRDGTTKELKRILTDGANVNYQNRYGHSALHQAASKGETETSKLLIESGIKLNLQAEDGKTALHLAAKYGKTETARLLIDSSCDVNIQEQDGSTALNNAAIYKHTDIVQLLIDNGIDINFRNKDGNTALHEAAKNNCGQVVEFFLKIDWDPNLINSKNGKTALHYAASNHSTEIVEILIGFGCEKNLQDIDGNTPLHIAAIKNRVEVVVYLLNKGCAPNMINTKNKKTALHYAASNSSTQVVQMLLEFECEQNLQDINGKTALHYAACNCSTQVGKMLLDSGCEKNLQDIEGNTALHIAARNENRNAVVYLLNRDCNPNIRNIKGRKPKDVAQNNTIKKLFKNYEKTLLPGLPIEVKKLDKQSAQVFSSLLKEESYFHFESRVMFAGEKDTGKTTIARYLVGKQPTKKRKSTDGIELYNGLSYVDLETKAWLGGQQDFSLEDFTISRSLSQEDKMRKSMNLKDTVSKDSLGMKEDVSVSESHESHDSSLFYETSEHMIKRPSEHVSELAAKTQENDETYQTAMRDKIFSSERLVSDEKKANASSNQKKQVELDHPIAEVNIDSSNDSINDDAPLYKYKPLRVTDGASNSIQTITTPGTIRKLKNLFGVNKKVDEVKVSITKKKFLKKSCRVGKKQLYNKRLAPIIIWDFGGQDVFYSTHQTFLTYRAIYIIVLDGSRKLDDDCPYTQYLPGKSEHKTARDYLRFWINTIVTYCKGSIPGFPKIIVVLTHKDQVEASDVENRRHELFEDISQMFEQTPLKQHLVIDDKIFVNAKNKHDPEMAKIKRVIIRESEQQPTWEESLPKCFIPLELEFASLIKRNVPLITVEHLQKINSTQAIRPLSETELKVFLKFQHSIGKVLYFDEQQLDKHVILSPTHLIDAFKSIVTDRRFCEGDNDREELWDVMGKKGVVPKKVIQKIWKKKKYCEFYKNKDYLLDVMTHLDILVEPKRYDSNHSRIPSDFYYVASMVRTTDDSGYLLSPGFTNRSIALAFQSSSLMIPPALSFRFISFCLNIWAVKTNEQTQKDMLFHRSVVFTIDASLDLHILCEDDMIVVRLVHSTSNTLIMRDMASSINECVTSALEKISQLYIRTSSDQNQTSSDQNQTTNASFITSVCCNSPDKPCILEVNKLGQMGKTWICPSHCITHIIHTISSWIKDEDEDTCKPGCPVTNENFLKEIPTDQHLRRLSLLYNQKNVRELAINIGLSTAEVENILETDDASHWNFEVLRQCRDSLAVTFNHIKDAMEAGGNNSVHILCKIFEGDHIHDIDFRHEPEKWDRILTEKHVDRLAPLIGKNSLPFLIELGMAFQTWEQISHRQNKRDLVGLNTDILEEWRTTFCQTNSMKPTLRTIALAFHNIGKNKLFIENVLFSQGSDIHNQ